MPHLILKRLRVHARPDGMLVANHRESPEPTITDDWWASVTAEAERRSNRIVERGLSRSNITLASMNREPHWVWLTCRNYSACWHRAPVALAPFIIRWGPDASRSLLAERLRCSQCGHLGADITVPSWSDMEWG